METILKLQKTIADFTDINYHTNSVIELATFLNDTEALDKLNRIKTEHKRIGHLPYELSIERSEILNDLLNKLKAKYGEEVYKTIYSAF